MSKSDYFKQFGKTDIQFMEGREAMSLYDFTKEKGGKYQDMISEVAPIHTSNGDTYVFTLVGDKTVYFFAPSAVKGTLDKVFADSMVDAMLSETVEFENRKSKNGQDYTNMVFV